MENHSGALGLSLQPGTIPPSWLVPVLLLQTLGLASFWYTTEELNYGREGCLFIGSDWCLPCPPPK